MVDTNTKDIPTMSHMLGLGVEVAIDCLRDNFNICLLSTLEFRLDFLWQCDLVGELPPAPISACTILRSRSLGIHRWALKVCGFESLPTICRDFNPADTTTTTRPGYTLHLNSGSILARDFTVVRGCTENALNGQCLDDGPLVHADLAAIFVTHVLRLPPWNLLLGNVNPVLIPADVRGKVAVQLGA
jgi:hypothetical protein